MEKQYLDLCESVLMDGEWRNDRTGTGTIAKFGGKMEFDLSKGKFPLWTTRKMNWKAVVGELLWFISGSTNARDLEENYGVKFWNNWASEDGDLGKLYGYQLRNLVGADGKKHDQLLEVIEQIKNDPQSRRHVLTTWNVGDLEYMNLPPCHGVVIQFFVRGGRYLDMQMYQRSADLFLGVSTNVASYSLLLMMVASVTGLRAGKFIHLTGDTHIYSNHIDQVKEQISRKIKNAPSVVLNPKIDCITKFTKKDIVLLSYKPHKEIKAKVSI